MSESPQVVRRGFLFSILPEWVLYHPELSDKAVRLFAILDRFAGQTGACWPSRKTLAEKLDCSVDTIDRVKTELVDAKALEIEPRPGTSNLYVLNGEDPDQRGRTDAAPPAEGGRMDAAQGGRVGAAQTRASEPEPPSPPPPLRRCPCGAEFTDVDRFADHTGACPDYTALVLAELEGGTPAAEIPAGGKLGDPWEDVTA